MNIIEQLGGKKWLILSVFIFNLLGCMNAERQAEDIKHCQSVGQDYWYNGFNQVFCKQKVNKNGL